jgi:hypothetical protein
MITFLALLLVATFAEEHSTESEYKRRHMDPEEGLAVVFWSKDYRFTKIADPGSANGKVWADTADASSRNLFVLDKDQDDWFIRDAHHNRRLGCAENTNIYAVPSDSTIWPDQLFRFKGPDSEGFYEIVNVHRPTYQIGLISSSRVGCWDIRWSEGKVWKWRLEDIFSATALWKPIAELDNISDVDGTYQYKKEIGYTKSIEKSEAHTSTISQSLEFSAGGALGGLDLGGTSTTTMTQEFSSSVSNAMSGTFTTTETLTWAVPAGKCLQILQIQISQDDLMSDIKNMVFYSSKTKIRNCPGRGGMANSGGQADGESCTKDAECASGDCSWTYKKCNGGLYIGTAESAVGGYYNSVSEEAKMALAMAASEATGPHWAVKAFAFVGFAASVYGAVRHYTGPKEEVTL